MISDPSFIATNILVYIHTMKMEVGKNGNEKAFLFFGDVG